MKALVVRFSAIGDCVMAVPVAESIRRRYHDVQLVWAVEPRCSPVIDTHTLVNELSLFPRDDWEAARWSPSTWFEQIRTYAGLRKHKFEYGIDVQGHTKTALCLRLAKPRRRIAVRANDTLSRKLNPVIPRLRLDSHTVEHNLMALALLGDFPQDPRWIMPTLEPEKEKIREQLDTARLATITVSAGQANKAYKLENWIKVADGLVREGYTVAFLGGPGDPMVPHKDSTNLVGKLPLNLTMAAVALSKIHLAADTGTGHLAAAYGTPVVSVFGPTNPLNYRPYTDRGVVLRGPDETTAVPPEDVIHAALQLASHAKLSH